MVNILNLFKKADKLVGLVALLTGIIFCLLSSGLRAEEETPIPVRTLEGHSGTVVSVAFSPDGRTLASGSGTIKLWDVSSGKCLRTLRGHSRRGVESVAFSPNGRTLTSGSCDKTIKLWDVYSGRCRRTQRGHYGCVFSVVFSPDGRTLASGSGTIKLWNVSSGRCLLTKKGHSEVVRSVTFSPDGKTLASGSDDETIKLWDVSSGRLLCTLGGHSGGVKSIAFSPNGRVLASGSEDKTIKLWDVSSGKCLHTLRGHSEWVRSVAFSPDGRTLASGSWDKTIKLWDVSLGKCLYTLKGHSRSVYSVAFSPDGRTLASGSDDKTIKLWDVSGLIGSKKFGFAAKAFEPPDLQIKQIAINDREEGDAYGNGNSVIEPNESIVVTAFVQNFGTGKAEDVKAKVILESTDPNISCPDAGKIFPLGDIPPGDYKPVNFYFFTSRRYSAKHIPLKVQLTEAKSNFGKTIDLDLKMNVRLQNIAEVHIAKIEMPKAVIRATTEIALSDVDDIPTGSQTKRPDGFAVVIGIEDYKYAPKATFASRDAEAFYGYATKVLGIPERNVYYRVNDGATAGEFKKLFEADGWLARRVTANSDVFIYYSGHGAPDIKTKSPYLIPYDIDPNYASTGFPLDQLYKNLHNLKAKSVTVVLDACFSGQSREEEMMLADARPVGITIESPLAYGDITVFAAASGRQISSGYPEQRHGLFSYFFLKGLKGMADADGNRAITVGELFSYVKANVPRLAAQMDREQSPQLLGRDTRRVLVKYRGTTIVQKPTYPVKLRGTISFSEPSGNDILDAGENASLKIHLTNEGKGNAYDLTFKIKPATNYPNIAIANPVPIKSLLAGKTTTVDIPLKASMDLSDGEVAYTVFVSEANGFDLDPPLKIRFRTQALRPPNLIVADYAIDDFNHNRKIERSEIVKVTARIQNTGAGEAKQVKATVSVGKNVFLTPDSKRDFDLGEMTSGQYKDISFSLFTNNIATSLPVTVTLSESYNRYGSTKRLDLPFNVVQKKASELVVQGKSEKPVTIKSAPQLVPDVDKNIPKGGKSNPNAVAVVIGISDYQNPNVPRAKFAKRDASVMREYLAQAFGYDPENILPRNPDELITAGTFKTLIRKKLPAYIRQGESDVFIYYSGHGAPSTATQEAFFVPYDCDPNYASKDNAYSVKEFYDDVAKLKAKSITLVIDACYTGQMGNGGMLINNASPVLIKVDNLLVTKSNVVIFTASTEEQVANWYPEKKHGMFTYFFLKGLQGAADFNGDKQITVGEMQRYLTDPTNGVPYWSNRKFQRPQTPVVTGNKNRVLVRY